MSPRTKAIGVIFVLITIILAVIADLFDWSIWVIALPAIVLEILFFISVNADANRPN